MAIFLTADGARSRSSSPVSTDLASYLPSEMADFLKPEMTTISPNSGQDTLKPELSVDRENLQIDESKVYHNYCIILSRKTTDICTAPTNSSFLTVFGV